MDKTERKGTDALYETILALKDVDECRRFFQDLCTPIELRSMEQMCIRDRRWSMPA